MMKFLMRGLFITAAIALFSGCGSENSTTPITFGSVTFSGTGTNDIFTGTTFSPSSDGLGAPRNLATNPNDVAFTWNHFGTGSQTTVRYSRISSANTAYTLTISSYGNNTTAVSAEWSVSSNTPINGVSYDPTAKQLTLSNVSVDGYANINAALLVPSNILLNGTLTHL